MAEVVEEMPGLSTGGNHNKYPWAEWLDGRVWKLTQSVTLPELFDDATGAPIVPEQVVEGDFSVSIEKMRTYARNAAGRRSEKKAIRTRSDTVVIEVQRHEALPPQRVEQKVLFMQAIPKMDEAAAVGRTGPKEVVTGEDPQQALDLDDVRTGMAAAPDAELVAQAQAELDADVAVVGDVVRQSDIEQPEPDAEPSEWVEIPPSEDPGDPYAPAIETPYPELDRPSAEEDPVTEVAAGTGEVFEAPGTSFVPGAAPAGLPAPGDEILGGDV